MKIPRFLHGTERDVRQRSQRVIKLIRDGASLDASYEQTDIVDTDSQAGLLLLSRPGAPISSQSHFIFYIFEAKLFDELTKRQIDQTRERVLFEELLSSTWSALGLMCMAVGSRWTAHHKHRHWDLLDAYSKHWSQMTTEGARYSSDLVTGGHLLQQVPSYLGPTLGYCGVPEEILRERLYSEGLPAMLKYVRRRGSDEHEDK